MNRRGFLTAMLKAAVGATILPPALTYARQWKTGLWTATLNEELLMNIEKFHGHEGSLAATMFIRRKLREEGFARKILTPVCIDANSLRPSFSRSSLARLRTNDIGVD